MFDSYIGDIDNDISVLAMDKILYDNGFSVTDSEIHSDSEYNTFFEALLSMDGYIDELKVKYPDLLVFLTGGHSFYFERRLKNSIFADINLVLTGLNRILEYNVEN